MEVCNKDRYPIFWQSAYFIHYWHSHSRSGQTREMSLSRIYFIYSCSQNSKINKIKQLLLFGALHGLFSQLWQQRSFMHTSALLHLG